jgi:hypothetical protein
MRALVLVASVSLVLSVLSPALGAQAAPESPSAPTAPPTPSAPSEAPAPAAPAEAPSAAPAATPVPPPADGAQGVPEWLRTLRISGLFFGDAYSVAEHHDPAIADASGFWLRRVNLIFDQKVAERWTARLRFEAASPGTFGASEQIEPYVKDAFLMWKGQRAEVAFGLTPTPTVDYVEAAWGYRPVERVIVDLQRLGGTRDLGVAVRGSFDEGKRWRYSAMVGNGSGLRGETNEGKKGMLSLIFQPGEAWGFEAYGDFESRPGETDRTTFHLFGYHKAGWGRVGLQAARQVRQQPNGGELDIDLASLFVVVEVGERSHLLARADRMFDPNPEGASIAYLPFDPQAESLLLVFGWDYAVLPRLSFIPNVEWITYDTSDGGVDPEDDVLVRLTASWSF